MGVPTAEVIGYTRKTRERFGLMPQVEIILYNEYFTRWDEVVAFAEEYHIDIPSAIIKLVNKGLSHLDD